MRPTVREAPQHEHSTGESPANLIAVHVALAFAERDRKRMEWLNQHIARNAAMTRKFSQKSRDVWQRELE